MTPLITTSNAAMLVMIHNERMLKSICLRSQAEIRSLHLAAWAATLRLPRHQRRQICWIISLHPVMRTGATPANLLLHTIHHLHGLGEWRKSTPEHKPEHAPNLPFISRPCLPIGQGKESEMAKEELRMIAECHPQGTLDARQVARLRHDLLAALAHGCAGIIISGGALRYGGVEGLAQLAALLDE